MTESDLGQDALGAVRGLGEQRAPDEQARARAAELDAGEEFDLRGVRDRDPDARHPWRAS